MIKTGTPTRFELFDNRKTNYTVSQVEKLMGCTEAFNSYLYDTKTERPCCDIRDDGVTLNDDQYTYYGYGWNKGELPRVMHSSQMSTVDNYLSCIWAIHNGVKQPLDNNAAGVGGRRGRQAFGFKANGEYVRLSTTDAKEPMTLTEVRDKLYDLGCVSAIILDGGSSVQVDSDDEDINSSKIVSGLVCVWLKQESTKEDDTISTLNIIQPNYKWAYGATLRKKTDYIVLHHVGAVGSFTPEQIHAEHLRKGWRGIGYNYYVRKDGTIYHGREENAAGGHTLNYNLVSIGICFEGNFEVEKMPLAQKEAGQKLVADVLTRYPSAKVVRHKDLNATACPGANFPFADITAKPVPVPTQTITYKVQIDLTDETKAEQLTVDLTAKGYKPYITTEVKA